MSDLSNEDIYLNITVHNGKTDDILAASYSAERNQPLLDNPSDYKVAVVRFDCPSTSFPIQVFNKPHDYSLTLYFGPDNLTSQQILTNFQIDYTTNPNPLISNPDYVYYFKQFCLSLNSSFLSAYNGIVSQYDAINGPGAWALAFPTQAAPFIYFEPTTDVFKIVTPVINDNNNPNGVEIWFNHALFQCFLSFMGKFYGFDRPDGKDVQIVVTDFKNNRYDANFTFNPTAGAFYHISQEFKALNEFYRVYKIVILSNSLVSRKEYISVYSPSSTDGTSEDGSVNSIGIVQDFDYEFYDPNSTRIVYNPSGPWRWMDLLSNAPLTKVDFQVFAQSERGALLPVQLLPNQNCNIKLCFRKKDKFFET